MDHENGELSRPTMYTPGPTNKNPLKIDGGKDDSSFQNGHFFQGTC